MNKSKVFRPICFSVPYELFITHDICHVVIPGTTDQIPNAEVSVTVKGKTDENIFEEICKLLNNLGNFTCVGFRDFRISNSK